MTTKADQPAPDAGADEELLPSTADVAHEDEQEEPSLEDLALEAGWTPKDKWRGDPGKHVGAAEFLRRTAKSQKSLASKLAQAEQQIEDSQKETDKRFRRLERSMEDRKKAELNELRADYERRLDEAIEAGDTRAARAIMEEREEALEELEEPGKADDDVSDEEWLETQWSGPAYPALQKDFWGDHSWVLLEDDDNSVFGDLEELITTSIMSYTQGKRPPTVKEYEEVLETCDRWLRKKHKDRYSGKADMDDEDDIPPPKAKEVVKPANGKRVPVLADGHRASRNTPSAKLSQEEILEADRCIKAGLYSDRDEWARVYFGENA